MPNFKVISNPPYNNGLDLKILTNLFSSVDEAVVVHPTSWLLDLKRTSPKFRKFRQLVSGHIKSIEIFDGNPVFGILLSVPCAIVHYKKNWPGPIHVVDNTLNEEYDADTIDDVTKYGTAWKPLVEPFFKKMKAFTANNNLLMYKVDKTTAKNAVQLARIRGHVGQDDFYTMVMQSDIAGGIRDISSDLIWSFATPEERENFLAYLKTDFVRFCLSLYKRDSNLNNGELGIIPYQSPFTIRYTDEMLFKAFDVSPELQAYIRKFIPDYYKLRKN